MRFGAAISLLMLFAGVQVGRQVGALLSAQARRADPVTASERRLAGLRDTLPAHGVVGYLSPVLPEKLFGNVAGVAHFYLMQYALAPVIVVNNPARPLVVADFYGTHAFRAGGGRRLLMLRDFGNGVVLLTREEP